MTRLRGFILLLAIVPFFTIGCTDLGDPVASEDPGDDPEPDGISFSVDVLPIFTSYGCLGCHAFFNSTENIVNVAAENYDDVYIAPGEPGSSVLYQKAARNAAYGGPMPPAGAAVSESDLSTIRTWIEEGAPDN